MKVVTSIPKKERVQAMHVVLVVVPYPAKRLLGV